MKSRPMLTAADCVEIAAAATAEALANNWAMSIAIVDDGGHLLHFVRMDGAVLATAETSQGKARTAAITGQPTKFHENRIAAGRIALLSLPFVSLQGAVPIMSGATCVGAIGASGAQSHEDEQVALAGMRAVANDKQD